MTEEHGELTALGPSTYRPGRAHCPSPADGTPTRGRHPVPPRVAEPVLQRFLDVMTELESGLAERWDRTQGSLTCTRAE
ncbi:hypothetical protein NI25_09450 [Streptomyces sp. CCM_MD2014]|nr:hypothetical protein NI25_09450 [Streptomyces sp. CCM_MD2014]